MTGGAERIELTSETGDSIRCRVARTFWTRLKGLMGEPGLPPGEGLLIRPCNSIHMFFMRFAIDVVFLDRDLRILKSIRDLAPGSLVGSIPGAFQVLEVAAGTLPESFCAGASLVARAL